MGSGTTAMAAEQLFPGWKRPGLIEASAAGRGHSPRTRFPGWKRPGLIEASAISPKFFSQGPISGVENAPASLKRINCRRLGGCHRHFRGGNAPASLKRYNLVVQDAGLSDFRGGNAPASLKHLPCVVCVPDLGTFPGWKRPGLIEATLTAEQRQEILDISGVETPRPH